MFEDKLLPEIGAALAGDCFDSLQEAINKAQVVKEKRICRNADPSFVFFFQGIEPLNKHNSFESTTSEIFKVPTIATVTQAPTKRKLEKALEELTSTLKSNTESFNVLSKQFAKFNEEGANFPVINIIDQNPSRRVQFSQPFQPSRTIQRYVKDTLT